MLNIILIFVITVHIFFLILFFNKRVDKDVLLTIYMLCFMCMFLLVVGYVDYLMS